MHNVIAIIGLFNAKYTAYTITVITPTPNCGYTLIYWLIIVLKSSLNISIVFPSCIEYNTDNGLDKSL